MSNKVNGVSEGGLGIFKLTQMIRGDHKVLTASGKKHLPGRTGSDAPVLSARQE